MQHEHPEIAYLSITPATKQYAKQHGARHNKVHGWHIFGLVPVELEEFIVSAPRERAHNNIVYCPNCGGQMRLINSRTGNIGGACFTPSAQGQERQKKQKSLVKRRQFLILIYPRISHQNVKLNVFLLLLMPTSKSWRKSQLSNWEHQRELNLGSTLRKFP